MTDNGRGKFYYNLVNHHSVAQSDEHNYQSNVYSMYHGFTKISVLMKDVF